MNKSLRLAEMLNELIDLPVGFIRQDRSDFKCLLNHSNITENIRIFFFLWLNANIGRVEQTMNVKSGGSGERRAKIIFAEAK